MCYCLCAFASQFSFNFTVVNIEFIKHSHSHFLSNMAGVFFLFDVDFFYLKKKQTILKKIFAI